VLLRPVFPTLNPWYLACVPTPSTPHCTSTVIAPSFVQDTLGYSFRNTLLLEEALNMTGLRSAGSNGRLAMIGDSRLKDVILDGWYASGASKGS
jgi:hypothetical protein